MDVKVKHRKTGLEKTMPEKVYNQVKGKYKFLGYVDDPNEKLKQKPTEKKEAAQGATVDPELEAAQLEYRDLTGKDPGKKSLSTLRKEIEKLSADPNTQEETNEG